MVKKKKNDGDGKSSTLFWLTIFLLVLIILCVVSLNQINDKINKLERSNEQEISQVIPSWEQLAFEAGWYGECVEYIDVTAYNVTTTYFFSLSSNRNVTNTQVVNFIDDEEIDVFIPLNYVEDDIYYLDTFIDSVNVIIIGNETMCNKWGLVKNG